MNVHKNAALTPKGREQMVRAVVHCGQSKAETARSFKTSWKTVHKWVRRYSEHGIEGLRDRSSRPLSLPSQIPPTVCAKVAALRQQRHTGQQIAREVGISPATVSRILKRCGLNRLKSLEPAEPVVRYERETPGEIIHFDIKKLGRFNKTGHRITGDRKCQSNQRQNGTAPGWEYVHVAIDDRSRVARADIFANERKESAIAFLKATIAYFNELGVKVTRIMTDNGACYRSKAFAKACRRLRLKHLFTKPYTPKTNGKAERFIQTAIREWAYARAYRTSEQRRQELPRWLHCYNWHRPHCAVNNNPPISRINLTMDNLVRFHI